MTQDCESDALVLLPGMMCDHRLFAPQINALDQRYTIITPDLVGADTMAGLAQLILDDLPDRFALAGLSMGGILAMEMIRQAPERVTRLALMDTNPFAEAKDRQALREAQINTVRAGGLKQIMRDEMKPLYLADTPNRTAILDLCMAMALTLGDDVFVQQSRALASRPDQAQTLRQVNVPTLILHGAEDILCPPERHHAMHDLIEGSELVTIKAAGHLPCLEQAEETTTALKRWLEIT